MKTRHFLAIVALIGAGSAAAISASAQGPLASSRKIEVGNCLVTLINDVMVPAQEAGRLMKVNVKGGESVDEDFPIAEIDNRDALAKQKIAMGELEVAETEAASEAEVKLGEKGVDVAKAEYDQSKEIRDRNPGAVSVTELRKYQFQLDRAYAQVEVAKKDHVVAGLTAKVKSAQVEATHNELARRKITSPFKGEVDEVKRQVGEWVQPGEPIARIVQLDRLRVKGMIYATDTSPTDVIGKPVEIKISTAGGRTEIVKGHIEFASSIIEVSNQFRVWCDIDNQKFVDPVSKKEKESWRIQPGSTATMVIDLNPPLPTRPLTPVKAEPAKGGPTLPGLVPPSAPAPSTTRPRSALEASGVKVESLKPIVSEPAATKAEEKKPEDKKPEDKKPDDKKPGEAKGSDSKPDDKSAGTKGKTKER